MIPLSEKNRIGGGAKGFQRSKYGQRAFRLCVTIPEYLFDRLTQVSKVTETTRSSIVREILEEKLRIK